MTDQLAKKVFAPHWPAGLVPGEPFRVYCDDDGQGERLWLSVFVQRDGDVVVGATDCREDEPYQSAGIRVRTFAGGGRNLRTHQALLWLARAIQLDNADNPRLVGKPPAEEGTGEAGTEVMARELYARFSTGTRGFKSRLPWSEAYEVNRDYWRGVAREVKAACAASGNPVGHETEER